MKVDCLCPSVVRFAWQVSLRGLAAWCVLSLHDAPIAQEHSICGPWGCGPTIPSLLAVHGFWLLVAIPGAFRICQWLTTNQKVIMGRVCLGLASIGIFAVALGALIHRPGSEATQRQLETYLVQLVLFALATTIQVPLFPTGVVGLIFLAAGRHFSKARDSSGLCPTFEANDGPTEEHRESTVSVDSVSL